jgi:hypothetical protein
MQFAITVDTHVSKWDCITVAEDLGYDRAWVPDSQMIWSDCYATLALAAVNTKRIHIGTGVAIPGTRIAPVTCSFDRQHQSIGAGPRFSGHRHGPYRDACDGPGSDAG